MLKGYCVIISHGVMLISEFLFGNLHVAWMRLVFRSLVNIHKPLHESSIVAETGVEVVWTRDEERRNM